MKTFLNSTPPWIWAALIGVLSTAFTVFVEAQWPGTPPAWAIAASTALVMLVKLASVYWPQPAPPELPPGVSSQAAMAQPKYNPEHSKFSKLLIG